MQRRVLKPALACAVVLVVCGAAGIAIAQRGGGPAPQALEAARKAPTPKLGGHPDFTGYWSSSTEFASAATIRSADGKKIEFQIQPPFAPRAGGAGPGGRRGGGAGGPIVAGGPEPVPPYKPELLAKVDQLAKTDVDTDPSFVCNPNGTPRSGAPSEIFQSKDAIVLLYQSGIRADYRVIPTDNRKHDDTLDPSWFGSSVGHWEGDTLVIESVNFTDESWLGGGGWFHSDKLKVVEKLTREGNTLRWEARVEDPEVLQRPWIMPPRTVLLGKAGGHVEEILPCHDRDQEHMVDKYHITP
jgi:hypothetical protein